MRPAGINLLGLFDVPGGRHARHPCGRVPMPKINAKLHLKCSLLDKDASFLSAPAGWSAGSNCRKFMGDKGRRFVAGPLNFVY